jgi:2-(1,2-epoxy-1,2-dihydrophenyl)acetyl-CoA isomerase
MRVPFLVMVMGMEEKHQALPGVRVEDKAAVRWVVLDRPDRLNALDLPTSRQWADARAAAAREPAVRAVVLAGEGRAFCSGGDLRAFREAPDRHAYLRDVADTIGSGVLEIKSMDKPVIAAVHGHASGVGLTLVLSCDLKLAATGTSLGMSYVNVGLSPGGGGSWMLPRMVGSTRAWEMLLLGEPVTAERALRMGLVTKVVPHEHLREEAQALGERMARGPREAIARIKRLLWASLASGFEDQLQREEAAIADAAAGPEFEEGSRAFLEKRAPRFG